MAASSRRRKPRLSRAVYAFFITVFVYKELKLTDRTEGAAAGREHELDAALHHHQRGAVLVLDDAMSRFPQAMAAWIIDKNFSIWVFLLVVNIILLLAGNVMDPSSILLIMAPILFSARDQARRSTPFISASLMIVNTEVGLCHPPVGLNLYIASSIAKMGISEITIAVLPWFVRDAGPSSA